MNFDLTSKHAMVCGSSRGIGKAIAFELARNGANITLLARNSEALNAVKQRLPLKDQQQHHVLVADFSSPLQLKKNVEKYIKEVGVVDILVNNTQGPSPGSAFEAQLSDFVEAFNNHLLSSQVLVQAVVGGMIKKNYGRIINIISTSVKQPIAGLGVSNTIRGAVANWSKTLAGELGSQGITVNNVLPGATQTERLKTILEQKALRTKKNLEEILNSEQETIPLKRFARPEEIASAVVFLASSYSSYINGINLPVDGGRTASL